jgi:hypothetical protein
VSAIYIYGANSLGRKITTIIMIRSSKKQLKRMSIKDNCRIRNRERRKMREKN